MPAIRHIRDELDADVAMIQPETMEALGAARGDVSWMVVRQSGVAVVLGVALGLAGASVAGHALETQLFGVAWYDPLTYVAVAVMIIGLGVLASWIPAFRAASVSPVRLLG